MNRLETWLGGLANRQGSSRAAGLLRIAIAALVLARWGEDVALFNAVQPGLIILSPMFFLFTLMMLVGYRTKTATFGLTMVLGVFYYLFGQRLGMLEWGHHHTYLLMIVTALLNGCPCEKSYSVDRWLDVRKAHLEGRTPPAERGYLWAQYLIGVQMAALYFWTAVDKTEWHFLTGERLERIFEWTYAGHPLYPLMTWQPLLAAASIIVVFVEYFIAYAVLFRKFKRVTMTLAIGLHIVFFLLLKVDTYSATMIALYLVWVNPDRLHAVIDDLQAEPVRRQRAPAEPGDIAKAA